MPRRFCRSCVLAVVAAVPLLGMTAAPAAAKTVTPQKWATGVCMALGTWQNALSDVQSSLTDANGDASLGRALAATDRALGDVKAAGVPAVPNGKQLDALVLNGFTQARKILVSDRADGVKVQTADQDLTAVSSQVAGVFDNFGSLDKGGKLGKVVRAQRACAFMNPSA
jgi:hypothetical protein